MKLRLWLIIAFISSLVIAYFIFLPGKPHPHYPKKGPDSYTWLNPLLRFREDPVIDKGDYVHIRNELSKEIEELKTQGTLTSSAILFRDLNSGPTFGINEYTQYIPASLLKVPLMLTYFRLAEEGGGDLLEKMINSGQFEPDFEQKYAPEEMVEPGKDYRIDDLLRRLIVYSDNRAWDLLYEYLNAINPSRDELKETYIDLGILGPEDFTSEIISAKSYAAIFRQLYNASYLNKEYSDQALQYLSDSSFVQALRRGVPMNVPVAHKFGERILEGEYQLHDCGIVYYPENPYLLCIMTSGPDIERLALYIGTVSEKIYKEVDSRRK